MIVDVTVYRAVGTTGYRTTNNSAVYSPVDECSKCITMHKG